jgi:branched-chain amino acid transport system ATP-binding protein
MTEPLRGEAVSKHFGGLKAVDEVDFVLEDGEILGLIGPNGAGKTTLFSVVAGSIPATKGTIFLEGRPISGSKAHRVVHSGVCRTHQIVRPFAKLTVLDNATVGVLYGNTPAHRPKTMRAARTLAGEELEFVGLGDRLGSLPGELTLADRKKLELARSLATHPRVLLLDEVVAGLNPAEAQRMVALIRDIRERGVSIIMIEHVMRAVMGLSDRVMVLDSGKKIAEGTAEEVGNDPRVIEAYLGSETETELPGSGAPPNSRPQGEPHA